MGLSRIVGTTVVTTSSHSVLGLMDIKLVFCE